MREVLGFVWLICGVVICVCFVYGMQFLYTYADLLTYGGLFRSEDGVTPAHVLCSIFGGIFIVAVTVFGCVAFWVEDSK